MRREDAQRGWSVREDVQRGECEKGGCSQGGV